MKKRKIYLVEDSSLLALSLKKKIEEFGHEVVGISADGKHAIKEITEKEIDLVLMDILLNGELDGIEIAHKINNIKNVPIVYLTGHSDQQKTHRAIATNPLGYIIKPVSYPQLKITLEMVFNKIEVDKELFRHKDKLVKLVDERTRMVVKRLNAERFLSKIAMKLMLIKDTKECLSTVLESLRKFTKSDNCFYFTVAEDTTSLQLLSKFPEEDHKISKAIKISSTISNYIYKLSKREIMVREKEEEEAAEISKIFGLDSIKSVIFIPVIIEKVLQGIILSTNFKGSPYGLDNNVFRTLSNLVSMHLERYKSIQILNETLRDKDALISEIYDRTNNNLQYIISLERFQLEQTKDKKLKDFLIVNHARLIALAVIQDYVYRIKQIHNIDMEPIIKTIQDKSMIRYKNKFTSIKTNQKLNKLKLDLKQAIPCALLINEILRYFFDRSKYNIELSIEISHKFIQKANSITIKLENSSFKHDIQDVSFKLVDILITQLEGKINVKQQVNKLIMDIKF
ncbi:MAG: response regulator [Candidatus Cloacimonetes bacterium]|jgi:two-component sensor histidine kinase/DNA-binding NarL/FixJ family response regulator|nr:response regulator [Candidatus Cloacimonadota bacterium]MBT4332663.1 response regulator [Candidatus Cloacimonadota bacterium]